MLINAGDKLHLLLDGGKSVEVEVEEYQPVDRAAYQWEAGWTCFEVGSEQEYFVARGGEVYEQPENRCVGVNLALAAWAEELAES